MASKKNIEEALKKQVQYEVEQCEDYLDDSIRPRIEENWNYYHGKRPKPLENESKFTSNSCAATTDGYVAACMDAFTSR